jgi:hypothetical protein
MSSTLTGELDESDTFDELSFDADFPVSNSEKRSC